MTVVVTHTTPADSTFSSTGAAAWNANHALSGVGTMAEQDANNVAITGGTINNTTVGGTTPSTGVFTTLTATGQTSLGGVAGAEGLRVLNTASSTRYVQIEGSVAGQPRIQATGATTSLALSGNGAQGLSFWSNSFATQQFNISHTATAVNYVQVTGAATGANPTISTQGSDANRGLTLSTKGTHDIILTTGGTAGWIRGQISAGSGEYFRAQSSSATPVNYTLLTGTATGISPSFSVAGSDTNIAQVFQSKGTGAIDLAAGSSGVNISNGGTVTAITRTAAGTGYTSLPTPAITAPTTAGGVQAVITAQFLALVSASLASGGTGYTAGDVLTLSGFTGGTAPTVTVSTVSAGVITAITGTTGGNFTAAPSSPASVTGGTGTSATITFSAGITSGFTITNAGSGYVEQPTVTFSGGGGSGAAAFAIVGSGTIVRTLGSSLSFSTPSGEAFRVSELGTTPSSYWTAFGGTTAPFLRANGSSGGVVETSGTTPLLFRTNSGTEQLRVAHTASAVNYVQVTGAVTGAYSIISAQGSDTNTGLIFVAKGSAYHRFSTNGTTTNEQLRILHTASTANRFELTGATAGNAPAFSVAGSDTNIDIIFTPKGTTGNVRFGTYTASILTPTGYVEIKDSGGTVRRLLVG